MRETFISILALLAIAPCAKCSDVGKDGFNFYKGALLIIDFDLFLFFFLLDCFELRVVVVASVY